MTYKKYVDDNHEKIKQLLDEMANHETELAESKKEIVHLKALLQQTEEITARKCLGGDILKGVDNSVPPEKRSLIKAAKIRIRAATTLFEKNFDLDGNPTSEFGAKLRRRYGWE